MKIRFLLLAIIPIVCVAQDQISARPPLQLTLKRAVQLALSPEGNSNIQLSGESVKQAQSRSAQARAALLPDLEGSIGQQNQTKNLEALGIRFSVPIPGFQFPTLVGPYNVFDVRATATQSIFNFSSIRRYQASRVGVKAAREEDTNIHDQVAAQVAKVYVGALRADADLDAAKANVALAKALLRQAQNEKAAGTGVGIEVTRASVQLSNEQQRMLVAQNAQRAAHLQLLRVLNLRMDTQLELTDKLEYQPVDALTLQQAEAQALRLRSDLKAQREHEENARLSSSATKMERLPSLVAFADYGSIGSSINHAFPTRTYGVSLKIPIFDGGRRDARRAEALSRYRQERIRTHDLKEQIALDLRLALDSLHSAEDQVKVAQEGLTLAEKELAQARRRYSAGVTTSIEVTDAQTRLERARDNQIAALFNYNQARIDLGQATGTIRQMIQ